MDSESKIFVAGHNGLIGSAIIKIIESYKKHSKSKISKQIEDFLIKFSKDKK